MALSDHVTLTITNGTVGVARLGFGVPLILSVNAAWSERVRSYTDIEGVAEDFASTSPEYLAALALFSQEPHPETIKIGRAVGKPTQVYTCNITTVTHEHTYKLNVQGPGITTTEVEYDADTATTDGEIVIGLVAALNAVTGNTYIAAGTTSPFTITADAPGTWFSIESPEIGYIKIAQTHVEPATTIADDITAIRAEDDAWYCLYTLYNSEACVEAAAAAIEPLKKIYCADISASETATLADGGSDTQDDLQGLNYDRTFTVYHPSPAQMCGAAWMGTRLPYEPGAATWKFAQPDTVTAVSLTSTYASNLVTKNANFLQTTAGIDIMREGVMVGGEFIDKVRDLDWLEDDLTKSVYEAMVANPKIPYTNAGVAIIEAAIRGSLLRAYGLGIIDSDFTITVPKVLDVSSSNRAIRLLPGVKFSCRMQGAIHKVTITGVVTV